MNRFRMISFLRRWALLLLVAFPLVTVGAEQKTFATPEEAVDALIAALKADDDATMVAIFGEQHKTLVVTPDRAALAIKAGIQVRTVLGPMAITVKLSFPPASISPSRTMSLRPSEQTSMSR